MKNLTEFQSRSTHHCVTGSLVQIYEHFDHNISEDFLLGIGGGVGFMYWQMKGVPPFFGGRAKGRPKDEFEICVGERTGVVVTDLTTSSIRKAETSLLSSIKSGQPVMLQVDMGYLPYFDFGGEEYHFGGHYVVAYGIDQTNGDILVADREPVVYSVDNDTLALARDSKYQPFAPKNRWLTFDFTSKRQPLEEEIRQAIHEQAKEMIEPPISNFGVSGIRKAAKLSLKWPEIMDEDELRYTLFNSHIFISADGGTGGGLFRYMFSRFLNEVAEVLGEDKLSDTSELFYMIGDRWEEAGRLFKLGWDDSNPAHVLQETNPLMLEIADLEESAWKSLLDIS